MGRANLHSVLSGVHALAPLEAVKYPVKTHTRPHFSSVVVTHTRTLIPRSNTPDPPALNWSFSLGKRALKILKLRTFDD